MTEAMDLFRQASVLTADSLLRPPETPALNSGLAAWRQGLCQTLFTEPVLSHHDLETLYSSTAAVDELLPPPQPGFVTAQDVVLCTANGCLYDSRTGFLLPACLSVRTLRSQRLAPPGGLHLPMHQAVEALPRLDQALVLPRVKAADDLTLLKQLMAYLWPLLEAQCERIRGLPVLLQPDLQASTGDGLLHLFRGRNAFPLLQSDLPPFLLIREALVPLPSLGLMAGSSPCYVETWRHCSAAFSQSRPARDAAEGDAERIFVIGSDLSCAQDKVPQRLLSFLEADGWLVINQSSTSLAERLAAYRRAAVIAAIDSAVLLELSSLGPTDHRPLLFVLGDLPNLDVVLMARALQLAGQWIRVFSPSRNTSAGRDRDWFSGGRRIGVLLNALTDQHLA